MKFLLAFITLIVYVALSYAWNYCGRNLKLCGDGSNKHFICDLEELTPLNGSTEFIGHVMETDKIKLELLDSHNVKRDSLASGIVSGITDSKKFPSASRMRELHWEPELAYMARMYTSRVTKDRPLCHNTKRFESDFIVGLKIVGDDSNVISIIDEIFDEFWQEHLKIEDPESSIANYNEKEMHDVRNFALMASDKVSAVGCAISMGVNCSLERPDYGCYFVACFYDNVNKDGFGIYKTGEPGESCMDWSFDVTSTFDHLC